jgi:Helix-loop-helix DNA-binding domain
MPISLLASGSFRPFSSSEYPNPPLFRPAGLFPVASSTTATTAAMEEFNFNDFNMAGSQASYPPNWNYPNYSPDAGAVQRSPAGVVYPEQQQQQQQPPQQQLQPQSHHQSHPGQSHPSWLIRGMQPAGAAQPLWPAQQQAIPHRSSLAPPPPRPEISRHNSDAFSSGASVVGDANHDFGFGPSRSPDPRLDGRDSLRSSVSFSSPPPPGQMGDGLAGSVSSSGGQLDLQQPGDAPVKRTRGRPRKIRPEPEPKPPRVSRRQPHNMVERKYREGLNKEMERLRSAIPNLDSIPGAGLGNKASKATVLQSAVDEIEALRKEKQKLEDELQKAEGDLDESNKVTANLKQKLSNLEEENALLRTRYGGRGGPSR